MTTLTISEIDLLEITFEEGVLACESDECDNEATHLIRFVRCVCSGTFCPGCVSDFKEWLARVSGKVMVNCNACKVEYRLTPDLIQILPI